ncbi:hypothetical protein [Streptomyces spectabilis]|uniref:Uncharacterized protein n=2 Tax=Streptomyces spectabilis TaxID=68270 RepID=A0A5P2X672_STRST|nr:hypothetical protein [Streptomyces spectabilis]MBB5108391.1 hypothetical protein [Streptomyces spectabilis]QEV58635.1 hypothetical protein CP982_07795 [Streptomyces spectabilis]GGV46243.1 hypothetical protein GCM10010245_72540 [Streptomyces spectabilis]
MPEREADPYRPLSDERIKAVRGLVDAVTPGPWKANVRGGVVTDESGSPLAVFGGGAQDRADAAFIAEAPEAVYDLLVEVAWQRKWSGIGWRKANSYHEQFEAASWELGRTRGLVARLRQELSRQARQRSAVIDDLRGELAAVGVERDAAQETSVRLAGLLGERDADLELLRGKAAAADRYYQQITEQAKQIDQLRSERDGLNRRLSRVLDLCDREQRNAVRWENPVPVAEWVKPVRRAALGDAKSDEAGGR